MIERRILQALLDVQDFPTLPEVMTRILQAVGSEDSSAADITNLLESDHAISARVLRLANSAFYGLRVRADSIRRAVIVIGFDAVKNLALATSAFDSLSKHKQFALEPHDFWKHSLGTAKAAQVLCVRLGHPGAKDICFTAGLLHDVGKFLLALSLKNEYRTVVEHAEKAQAPLRQSEAELIRTTHAEVGAWLAGKWRFPQPLVNIIGNLYRLSVSSLPNQMETAVVALSSEISRKAGFGDAGESHAPAYDPSALAITGITGNLADTVATDLSAFLEETEQFLDTLSGANQEDSPS